MTGGVDATVNWGRASRQWSVVKSPLRPAVEDIAFTEAAIARHSAGAGRAPSALLLGVTPELAACRWPAGTCLRAIDNSRAMIDALWPAPGVPDQARVLCADWRAMPLASASVDIVVGDGCYSAAPFPDAPTISREVRRVLRDDGFFAIRVFTRPDMPESVADLRRLVGAGRVGSVHALKWRVAGAIQESIQEGVRLGDIWDAFQTLTAEMLAMGGGDGWSPEEIASLDRYRDNDTRFYFPTAGEFRAATAPWLEEVACRTGGYELAERCPIFLLRPRPP